MTSGPLVSIGIPTYNRAHLLGRAVGSAISQDHPHVEVIVSDNASTDGTERLCRELAEQHPSLRYLCQPRNRGSTANFNAALDAASGEYFMWLADDDTIDSNYVSTCLDWLVTHSDHSLVAGQAIHHRGAEAVYVEQPVALCQEDPETRVCCFFTKVSISGVFYGLMRRHDALACRLRPVMGGDCLVTAGMAFTGKVRTLPTTTLRRSAGGCSSDLRSFAASEGMSPLAGRFPFAWFAGVVVADIGWRSPSYQPLSKQARLWLGSRCAAAMLRRVLLVRADRALGAAKVALGGVVPAGAYAAARRWYRARTGVGPQEPGPVEERSAAR